MKLSWVILAVCASLSSSVPSPPALPALAPGAERCAGIQGYAASFEGRRTFLWRPVFLNQVKTADNAEALRARIVAEAEQALIGAAPSVMTKTGTPPSGDKHDYFSWPIYWWRVGPNEYVFRDNQNNPASKSSDYDPPALREMLSRITYLSLGYFLTDDHRYSRKASELLAAWFVDPATLMNPNLNFGQAVPGNNKPPSVIETTPLTQIPEAIGLLEPSGDLPADAEQAIETWFSRYVDWLIGRGGRADRGSHNNHALAYDLQVAEYALFARRAEVAAAIIQRLPTLRLSRQVAADGRQPYEASRERGLFYSIYTLGILFRLADLGECLDVDLWTYRETGGGIRPALDFLVPYFGHEEQWPYKESDRPSDIQQMRIQLLQLLAEASLVYREPRYFSDAVRQGSLDLDVDSVWWPGPMALSKQH